MLRRGSWSIWMGAWVSGRKSAASGGTPQCSTMAPRSPRHVRAAQCQTQEAAGHSLDLNPCRNLITGGADVLDHELKPREGDPQRSQCFDEPRASRGRAEPIGMLDDVVGHEA